MSIYKGVVRQLATVGAALLLGVLSPRVKAQTFNVYEGLGVLENAWQDWSWCSRNFQNTSYVYEGKYSIEVDYTGGWQGFYLNSPSNFSAGYFSNLSFYINGGPNSGRTVEVFLTVNGNTTAGVNLNSYVAGGSVAANKWSKVTIPLSAFNLKPTDQISQVLLQEAKGTAQPPFYIGEMGWTPAAVTTPVTVTVSAATNLRTVDAKLFGVNTAIWDWNFTSAACKALIAEGAFKAFRYPGGSSSDAYNWQTNKTQGSTTDWGLDFDDFASIAVPQSKGQAFITVNYGTGTAAEAANWVKYSNVTKKYGFKYWEVGNEVYGGWEMDSHALTHDPVTYANQFAAYYKQMKATDPTISVGAVSIPGEDSYSNYASEVVTNPRTKVKHSGWTPVMLATLAKLNVTPDFIIYHRYPESGEDSDFTLLAGNTGWATDIANLRQQLKDYLGTKNTLTQIMCTENNADSQTAGKQLTSLTNGIYLADSFGSILQTECNSYMWWDLINGQSTNSNDGPWLYGWRTYGDEGMFSPDFTQTYPIFYTEQLVNDFAAAGDTVLSTTSSYGFLTAYTTKRSDGTLRVMLINKSSSVNLPTKLVINGFTPAPTATEYSYGVAQDTAASEGKSQAVQTQTISNASASMTVTVPAYTIIVYAFKPK